MKIKNSKILLMIVLLSVGSIQCFARELKVGNSYQYRKLDDALNSARDGDTILVDAGKYTGHYTISKSLTLIGNDDPIIDGNNWGTILTIEAPNVEVTGFIIQNSGILLDKEDAGILVKSQNVKIIANHLKEVLFGIYFRQADGSILRNNFIEGKKELDIPRRGDLFRGWYCRNIQIIGNTFKYGRDVIIWFSHDSQILENNISGARYGLHFMYNADCRIIKNVMSDNSVGMYLMYSKNLQVERNLLANNKGASGFGIGLKDLDNVELNNNIIADNRVGIFIDNSPRNINTYMKYNNNVIAYNENGIDVLSTLENSYFKKNSFIENYQQVSLTRTQDPNNDYWDGNYWSDYSGYDKDGNGAGDISYKSAELIENLLDDKPNLKVFLYSPAVNTLNYAARAFPVLEPQPNLIDKVPMTKPLTLNGVPVLKAHKEAGFIFLSLILSTLAVASIFIFLFKNKLVHNSFTIKN